MMKSTYIKKSKEVIFKKNQFSSKVFQSGLLLICFFILESGCKKFLEIPPPTSKLTTKSVYSDNSDAEAAIAGIYMQMEGFYDGTLNEYCGLSADEMICYNLGNSNLIQVNKNMITTATSLPIWGNLYTTIYSCNAAIEGLSSSNGVTPSVRQQLIGESEFLRAFNYFYLINLYGDIPLATTTNYLTNSSLARTPKSQIFDQIISDLKDAQSKLSENFLDGAGNITNSRSRVSKSAATAMLSRVYLYLGNWQNAINESTKVINDNQFQLVQDLNMVFLANSKEAILQFQPIQQGANTASALLFVLTRAPGSNAPFALSNNLVNSFELNDARFKNWIGTFAASGKNYYYPYKYKIYLPNQPLTEYFMVLRLAEQYLIRSEAQANLGGSANLSNAVSDLNMIRTRASLPSVTAVDQATLLLAIQHERQVELFTEFGHRWLDLKRTGAVDSIMGGPNGATASKGGVWNSYQALYPVPIADIQNDPHLQQNPGY